jgi:hypothetical protein
MLIMHMHYCAPADNPEAAWNWRIGGASAFDEEEVAVSGARAADDDSFLANLAAGLELHDELSMDQKDLMRVVLEQVRWLRERGTNRAVLAVQLHLAPCGRSDEHAVAAEIAVTMSGHRMCKPVQLPAHSEWQHLLLCVDAGVQMLRHICSWPIPVKTTLQLLTIACFCGAHHTQVPAEDGLDLIGEELEEASAAVPGLSQVRATFLLYINVTNWHVTHLYAKQHTKCHLVNRTPLL